MAPPAMGSPSFSYIYNIYNVYLQIATKVLRLFVHHHVIPLQILVSSFHIRVASLIARYHNTLTVGQITNARILQRVELVTSIQPHPLSKLLKRLAEYAPHLLLLAGPKVTPAKQKEMTRVRKNIKVNHHLDKIIIQSHRTIAAVFRMIAAELHLLPLDTYILNTDRT